MATSCCWPAWQGSDAETQICQGLPHVFGREPHYCSSRSWPRSGETSLVSSSYIQNSTMHRANEDDTASCHSLKGACSLMHDASHGEMRWGSGAGVVKCRVGEELHDVKNGFAIDFTAGFQERWFSRTTFCRHLEHLLDHGFGHAPNNTCICRFENINHISHAALAQWLVKWILWPCISRGSSDPGKALRSEVSNLDLNFSCMCDGTMSRQTEQQLKHTCGINSAVCMYPVKEVYLVH